MSQGNKPNGKEEMQSEYDIRGGVRGKYYNRYQQGASVVFIGPTEPLTRDQVQVILDTGDFDNLIGAVENDWLEFLDGQSVRVKIARRTLNLVVAGGVVYENREQRRILQPVAAPGGDRSFDWITDAG